MVYETLLCHAGVDYNLTLSPLQSRLQHIYHVQPYARVDLNPMPESTLSPSQGVWIWPQFRIYYLLNCLTLPQESPTNKDDI
jgi:hypothetical protein